jgi:hypothetical protein
MRWLWLCVCTVAMGWGSASQAHCDEAKASVIRQVLVGSVGAAHCTQASGAAAAALLQQLSEGLQVPPAWLAEAEACWAASVHDDHAELSALLDCESQRDATSLLVTRVAAPLASTSRWDELYKFIRRCDRADGPHAAAVCVLRVRSQLVTSRCAALRRCMNCLLIAHPSPVLSALCAFRQSRGPCRSMWTSMIRLQPTLPRTMCALWQTSTNGMRLPAFCVGQAR